MSENPRTISMMFTLLVLILLCATVGSFGQEQQVAIEQVEEVPPPLITLSKDEADQLKIQTNVKQRTLLCLQLADSRLQQAETLTNKADFQDALAALGGYQAVIDNGLNYIKNLKDDSSKVRDNVKRLEIALRQHAPRLEIIRRSTPFEYALRLKIILKFAREARSRALNLFFSDTVVAGETSAETPVTNNSGASSFHPEKKQP
ncbi:MAG: hypothetical protein ABI954_15360 [Pyrinomonadaceae bacterium]